MSSNLTLYSDLQEPFANYGLQHFCKKYSIISTNKKTNADIYLGYSLPETGSFRIRILLNNNAQDGCCDLRINKETIPIFKKPLETTGEYPLGKIVGNTGEYVCLSTADNRIVAGFDIFGEMGRTLAGQYDEHYLRKDELGTRLRSVPVVDVLEETLFSAINNILPGSVHHFTWPDDHKFAVVLTHDVDRAYKTYQYLPSILTSIKKAKPTEFGYHLRNLLFKHGKNNPYWTFDNICELENDMGVKSTYYFLNEKGKLNPFSLRSWIRFRGRYDIESLAIKEVIRKLDKDGFEIGVHGSYNSCNNIELLKSEKKILDSIICSSTKGIRQHYLNYDANITPLIHENAGFEYDTSLGYKPESGIGFRRGTSFPFNIMLPDLRISSILEIPLLIMDGALNRTINIEDCLNLIQQVQKYSGVLTILWHNHMFNNREYPGLLELYSKIVDTAKSQGAWVAPADKVCAYINSDRDH